jgi:hypothetical protein
MVGPALLSSRPAPQATAPVLNFGAGRAPAQTDGLPQLSPARPASTQPPATPRISASGPPARPDLLGGLRASQAGLPPLTLGRPRTAADFFSPEKLNVVAANRLAQSMPMATANSAPNAARPDLLGALRQSQSGLAPLPLTTRRSVNDFFPQSALRNVAAATAAVPRQNIGDFMTPLLAGAASAAVPTSTQTAAAVAAMPEASSSNGLSSSGAPERQRTPMRDQTVAHRGSGRFDDAPIAHRGSGRLDDGPIAHRGSGRVLPSTNGVVVDRSVVDGFLARAFPGVDFSDAAKPFAYAPMAYDVSAAPAAGTAAAQPAAATRSTTSQVASQAVPAAAAPAAEQPFAYPPMFGYGIQVPVSNTAAAAPAAVSSNALRVPNAAMEPPIDQSGPT